MASGFDSIAYLMREFIKDRQSGVIDDGVNCIQAQSVEMIFIQPIKRVVDEVVTNGPAFFSIEIDGLTPGRLVARGEELRSVESKIISFGAEVVINNI